MKDTIRFLLVLNVVFFSTAFFVRRFEQSSENGTDASSNESTIRVDFSNFQQKLDHFDFENDRKWNQRAWYSTTYFKNDVPAFLLITGEWAVDENANNEFDDTAWVSYAKTFNAACFSLEHRYYGKSWPEKSNMKYLNSVQVLADIAYFIKTMSEENSWLSNAQWIVFGCSYAGNLAAWVRLEYPHLVHGAVASSAPILSEVVYKDYVRVVEKKLESYDLKCVESIERATREITDLANHTENIKNVSEMFQLRNYHQSEDMIGIVKTVLADMDGIILSAVQYNDTIAVNIPIVCDTMINHNGTKIEAFAELRKKNLNSKKNNTSTDYSAGRTWSHQFCSEMGGFAIFYNNTRYLSAIDQLRPLEGLVKEKCEPFFGPNFGVEEMNERMQQTNFLYGGLNFNAANTLFIHGSTDPWHIAGVYNATEDSLYETIFIDGTSHCSDMYLSLFETNPELKKAYDKVVKILKKWLKK